MSDITVAYSQELELQVQKARDEFRKALAEGRFSGVKAPDYDICVICFRPIPKGATVCSEQCKTQLIKQRRHYQAVNRQLKKKYDKLKWEIEHNLHPTTEIVTVVVTGLKKDIERFKRDIREIAPKYNLEPWREASKPSRRIENV